MTEIREDLIIDQCSLYSVYIEAIVIDKVDKTKEHVISNATGFVYKYSDKYYLVSNWHVFSGRNANDLSPLDKQHSALPEKIRIHFPIDGKIDTTEIIDYPLIDESNNNLWLEHPQKHKVDVAALNIEWKSKFANFPINQINEARGIKNFPDGFYVGQDVFILGYPKGIKGGGGLPIWKRATIAAEPYLAMNDNELKILIDAATREGMSGSPVIYAGNLGDPVLPDGRKQIVNTRPSKLFLGVYSGRIIGEDELAAQLGIVWKEQAIREIIEAINSDVACGI